MARPLHPFSLLSFRMNLADFCELNDFLLHRFDPCLWGFAPTMGAQLRDERIEVNQSEYCRDALRVSFPPCLCVFASLLHISRTRNEDSAILPSPSVSYNTQSLPSISFLPPLQSFGDIRKLFTFSTCVMKASTSSRSSWRDNCGP